MCLLAFIYQEFLTFANHAKVLTLNLVSMFCAPVNFKKICITACFDFGGSQHLQRQSTYEVTDQESYKTGSQPNSGHLQAALP